MYMQPAAITCSSLLGPDNGQVTYSTDTTSPFDIGTMATYSCNTGFGLSGGDATRSCGGDGSSPNGIWSGMSPTCQGMYVK